MTDLWLSGVFFQALIPAYDAPPDHLVSWGGEGVSPPHTFPPRRLRRLDLGASVVCPPTQIPGYAYDGDRHRQ